MREIGAISDRDAAKRFADYLLTLGIASRVDHEPAGWVVWVRDEDQVDRGRQELETFLRDPNDPRYQQAPQAAETLRHQEVQREREFTKRYVDVRSQWGRMAMRRRPVTIAVIAICVLVALLTDFGQSFGEVQSSLLITKIVAREGDKIFLEPGWRQVLRGEIWRVVTPVFIHFNIPHIVFNLWAWYVLASAFEIRRGTWRLVGFFLVTAVISNAAQYEFTGSPLFGGLSGVVYGLFGYIWMKSRFDPGVGLYIDSTNTLIMLVWLFLCMTGMLGPIANTAHVAGLVVGVVVGIVPVLWRKLR